MNMLSRKLQSPAALLLTASATLAIAQNNTANDTNSCIGSGDLHIVPALTHPNATGSYSRTGFMEGNNGSTWPGEQFNWTYNTAIHIDDKGLVFKDLWVETPNLDLMKAYDVPVSVCTFAFPGLPKAVYDAGQNDTGDCLLTLDRDCVNALESLHPPDLTGDLAHQCSSIQSQISASNPPECAKFGLTDGYFSGVGKSIIETIQEHELTFYQFQNL